MIKRYEYIFKLHKSQTNSVCSHKGTFVMMCIYGLILLGFIFTTEFRQFGVLSPAQDWANVNIEPKYTKMRV